MCVCVCVYIYMYVYILSHFFHYGLLRDIEYSSLCYAVGPCCLIHSIYNSLHMLIPNSHCSPPSPPISWHLQVCSQCL